MAGNTKPSQPVVVDASVILSWLLPDENPSNTSQEVWSGYLEGSYTLLAPNLLLYEVLNALRSAVVQKRLRPKDVTRVTEEFLAIGIKLEEMTQLGVAVVKTAAVCKLSVYDAAYLVLAREKKIRLFTLDRRLLKFAD